MVTVADPSKIDFETAPGHAYTISVNSSDGITFSSQNFTINVTDIAPSTPVDSNAAANTVAEGAAANTLVGITASSTDVNGPGVTYSLNNNANGAFKIDATTGVVSVADPTKIDFESTAPGHTLSITAVASDGTLTSSQNFTINVSDVSLTTPVDGNGAANAVAEGAANGSAVGITASAVDPNGPATTYSLIGDTSLGGFTINATTGVVTVADSTKIDFETSAGHAYSVTVQATTGAQTTSQSFAIAVTDVAPSNPIDSNATANTISEGAANGSTVGVTASSTDINGPAVTYSLTGDTSGGGFTINAATGVVTVADSTKIDYETAAGHAYTVTAQASDGTLASSQTFTIAVSDVAPSTPVDGNAGANTIAEGAANGSTVGITASSTDVNGPGLTYSLTGDTSGGGFTINATTGVVTVADPTKIDYETAPGHAYTITAQASDGTLTSSQTFTVAVTDVVPSTPIDGDAAASTVAEGAANGSTVGVTVSSTDVNGPAVTYSLTGDTSGGGFTINATTGVIAVADTTKIDYESAAGHVYTVTAQASDGTLTNSQSFVISVTDVAPSTPVDSNAAANQVVVGSAAGATVGVTASATDINGPAVTYSLVGDTSGGGFTINGATGVVTVADSSKILVADPSYDITVDSSDGTLNSQQTFTVNVVTNLAPAIDSDGSGTTAAKSVAENQTTVTTVRATDPDNGPSPVTYSVVGGDDAAKFTIVSSGAGAGNLSFITAPDFENPTDTSTAGTNTYIVTVQASDGVSVDTQTITVTVTDANDAPVITSNGGGPTASVNVNENATAVTTVTATDQDVPAQTLTYSILGGADAAKFTIDASGHLSFVTAPNFEAPTDSGTDNGYDVIVRVTDNGAPNLHDDQAITVHVQDVNEAPDTNAVTTTGNEDASSIPLTITGIDPDAGDSVASFHITNIPSVASQGKLYSDAGLTTQITEGSDVTATGNAATVYFVPNANYNTHAGAVTFSAAPTDTHGLTDATPATETINVSAINDAPVNNGVPASFVVESGSTHAITGLSISDIDANEVSTPTDITTTLASGAGLVTIGNGASGGTAGIAGGATITTNGSGSVVLTGSIAQINTTLSATNGVVYTAADNAGNSTTSITMTTNDHGHTGTPGALSDVDTIQVGVIPQVWFINQDQTSLDSTATRGSQTNPFTDVHEFNTSSGPGTNDYIYVKAGTYTGEGINLKDGQTLLGDDQALSFTNPLGGSPIVIETASGARPTINVTTASDQGIALAQNNTISGINVTTGIASAIGIDDGEGVAGHSVGTLNITNVAISGLGEAVDIDHGGALNVTLDSASSSGGTYGIQLGTSVGGTALTGTFNGGTGSISGSTTAGFLVGDGAGGASTGGTAVISYAGSISETNGARNVDIQDHATGAVTLSGNLTHTGTGGSAVFLDGNSSNVTFSGATDNLTTGTATAINVTNHTGGTVAFSGTVNVDTTSGTGVNLSGNAGGTVNFTGGNMTIDTTGGNGFVATGAGPAATTGGTVNITGTGNHINSGNGTALNITNTTIGASNLTFQDISSSGGSADGIILSNTGTSGGLHITGTGSAGTGGTIANKTGADILTGTDAGGQTTSGTNGVGVFLHNTSGVQLDRMQLNDFSNFAIYGNNVTNFSLDHSTINGTNGSNNAGDREESSIRFDNLLGTSSINNSSISGGYFANVDLYNTSGTLNRLTMDTDAFGLINTTGGNDNVSGQVFNNATANYTVTNSTFAGTRADFIAFLTNNNTTMDAVVRGNTFHNGQAIVPGGGTAIDIRSGSGGFASASTTTFDISHNTLTDGGANAFDTVGIFVAKGQDNGTLSGTIASNAIGPAKVNSNSDGIFVRDAGNGTLTTLIQNNTITGVGNVGIHLQNNDGGSTLNASIYGNTVSSPTSSSPFAALLVDNGATAGPPADTSTTNVVIGSSNGGAGSQNTLNHSANYATDVSLSNFGANTHLNLSRNGSSGISAQAIIRDDNTSNTGTINVDTTGGNGAITLVNTLPALPAAVAPLLAGPGGVEASTPNPGEMHLTQAQLDTVVVMAIAQWAAAGASASQIAALQATTFSIANLSGTVLGEESAPSHITIDIDAAGKGWFIDPTPHDNFEFLHTLNAAGTDLLTDPTTAAAGHFDLLTTVSHELGHVLGLPDTTDITTVNDLMYIDLAVGERRLPGTIEIALAPTTTLTPTVSIGPALDAGKGGGFLVGSGGADNFVFANFDVHAPAVAITHVTDYHFAEGDTFDFSALTSQFHATGIDDGMIVRAVEDSSGQFATLQVNAMNPNGPPVAANWVSVAQIDGAHAGDAINVLIDSHSATHLAQIHAGLLV